jgi:Domain of unknown function (DUF4345)
LVIVIRIVLALIATFFIVIGLRFMLTPDAMAWEFFVTPIGADGLSTIRGDLGGTFIGIGALIVLGLRPFATRWLHAAALIIAAVALGRIVGLAFDGFAESAAIACVVEIVFVVLLEVGARRLGNMPQGR